ncbi:hypothetical protein [Brevibacillus laterosporus]|uniref:Uncharacterized protein n=1 Tax=Brevibacillus laterosporus TaxID=1465 RepID=A0AAP3DIR1_BRELA|nr:hypothetical protein [Brevibacillus laterosporus]MCR8981592.1 hypothetical protein [Brevibacillus laterosporus]MCZ0808747.1 hypothetical protein [Brevibacillus laterosporus]MCZ0827280.1 hypothetical protein [Brevibacillus laterosporus]MCZ0851036.1 hypothetical protein [Brevibacillus laterosporus]
MDNLLMVFITMSIFQLLLYTSKGKKKEPFKYIVFETIVLSLLVWGGFSLARALF